MNMTCGHNFVPGEHPQYEVCTDCGTFHSLGWKPPEEIYGAGYWSELHGHSTIQEQVYNCDVHEEGGVSKNRFVMEMVHTDDRAAALEIGCAPGKLLYWLKMFFGFRRVVGIDTDSGNEAAIRRNGMHGGELLFGYFPFITAETQRARSPERDSFGDGSFSLIVALDVFEHVPEGGPFLAECARLLKPEGQLILMLPLTAEGMDERFFHPEEHIWIYSRQQAAAMVEEAGFTHLQFDRWCVGHDVVTGMRRKD